MDVDSPEVQAYLSQLNQMSGSDPEVQVSMYEVGEALGIDNDEAGRMAEVLFMGGHAELKTLSGGIGITSMGMKVLGVSPVAEPAGNLPRLSGEPVFTNEDRKIIDTLLDELKAVICSRSNEYQILETTVIDVKTIEVQMLSPAPKSAVITEVLKAIAQTLPQKDCPDILERIKALAGE